MKAEDYLNTQIESMCYLQDSVFKDVSDDILMKLPIGTVSPIGVIWLHIINGQDNFLSVITGNNTVWEVNKWNEQFGFDDTPTIGEDWSQFDRTELTGDMLRNYSDEVRTVCNNALDISHSNTLDESVKFFTESDPKANVWVLMVGHTLLHCGEIAAIKGILGGKGLPF